MGAAGQVQGCSQGNNSHLSDNSHLTDLFKDQSFPILSDIATQRWYIVPHTMEPNHRISGGIASQVVLMVVESKLVSFFSSQKTLFVPGKLDNTAKCFTQSRALGRYPQTVVVKICTPTSCGVGYLISVRRTPILPPFRFNFLLDTPM